MLPVIPVGRSMTRSSWPLAASQTCTLLSVLEVATRVPSGDQATLVTAPSCPM